MESVEEPTSPAELPTHASYKNKKRNKSEEKHLNKLIISGTLDKIKEFAKQNRAGQQTEFFKITD